MNNAMKSSLVLELDTTPFEQALDAAEEKASAVERKSVPAAAVPARTDAAAAERVVTEKEIRESERERTIVSERESAPERESPPQETDREDKDIVSGERTVELLSRILEQLQTNSVKLDSAVRALETMSEDNPEPVVIESVAAV